MNLPFDKNLPIHLLSACFNNTSSTYKYYWFLALIVKVEEGFTKISKKDLFAEMIGHAWFTVNYFHVSFGKQDQLQNAILRIKEIEKLMVSASKFEVAKCLISSEKKETLTLLKYFNGEVPHRFLSPWFPANNIKNAYKLSQDFTKDCLYALFKEHLVINSIWQKYLIQHAGILKQFCYWNLTLYLQSKNPNVPDIPNKLIKSPVRKDLRKQRKFWNLVLNETGGINCIYTNNRLEVGGYALEHFVPHAFVSHDLIWNLIPADPKFNLYKSDRLPKLELYFEQFFNLQKVALEVIMLKEPENNLLQDYLTVFPTLEVEHLNRDTFLKMIQPIISIASQNGFEFMIEKELASHNMINLPSA